MDHHHLLADLRAALDHDAQLDGLDEQFENLARLVQQTVSGYVGLRLVLVHSGLPITVDAWSGTAPGRPGPAATGSSPSARRWESR